MGFSLGNILSAAAPLIGGGLGAFLGGAPGAMAGASIGGGVGSAIGGANANTASAKEAAKNRDFQQEMSSTAHQREVIDLRAAGLNPILSGTGGTGASTPSGSTAQQTDIITPAFASAMGTLRTLADAQKTMAEKNTEGFKPQLFTNQAEMYTSQFGLNRALSNEATARIDLIAAQKNHEEIKQLLTQQTRLTEVEKTKIASQDYEIAKAELAKARIEGKIDNSTFGEILRVINRGLDTLNKVPLLNKWLPPATSSAGSLRHTR
ncbi:MAG: DNA pilot protein [Microviridae sp.]|nr:MAG: DNA pilot protein [Microviridae sp.]